MKKLLNCWWLAGMCVLFLSGLAIAGDMAPPVADDMVPIVADDMIPLGAENMIPIVSQHHFELSLVGNYFEYEEPGIDVKIDGFMYGVIGSYTHHDKNKLMVNASLELSHGDLEYDGWISDGFRVPAKDDTRDWIVEGRFLVGHDCFLRVPRGYRRHLITPYIGLGIRYWHNDIEGYGGYEREVRYWYLPIGIKTNSCLSDHWQWRMNAEYDFFLGGRVKSYLSDVDPGFNDPAVDQDFAEGYGLRFSLGLTRKLSKIYALSIEPYITYWDIDKSDYSMAGIDEHDRIIYVYEPANKTTSYGLRISLEF